MNKPIAGFIESRCRAAISSIALILMLLLGSSSVAKACTCAYLGAFESYSNTTPIVVRATILGFGEKLAISSDYYSSLVAEITEVYKGNFANARVTLLGDRGMDCRSYISLHQFEIGDEYLFSLTSGNPTQALGGCGESFVKIEENMIHGSGFVNGKWGAYSSTLADLLDRFLPR